MLFWLAVGAAIVACCSVMAPASKVGTRSDAEIPAELLPGEHRGPTAEAIIRGFDRNDPASAMPPDVIE